MFAREVGVFMFTLGGQRVQAFERLIDEVSRSNWRAIQVELVGIYQNIEGSFKIRPIEETLEALHDIVKAGKVRYIGASSMFAWQFAKAQEVARRNGWTTFVTMQNLVNLLYREEEREMLPLCQDQGVGVLPWSPLARGRLTRPADVQTERSRADDFGNLLVGSTASSDEAIIGVVQRIAERRRIPMAQVALAWVLAKPAVSAPIVGASKIGQLDDALAALKVELTTDELIALEEPYTARAVVGHN